MSEAENPNTLKGATALEAVIPPQASSLRSFTIYRQPQVRAVTEQPSPCPSVLSSQPLNLYTETWTPSGPCMPPNPPSPPRSAQAILASNWHPHNIEANEPFPALVDPANDLINARTQLLDSLRRRSVTYSQSHPGNLRQHLDSLVSRMDPHTGHIKADEDLTRSKADLLSIMATSEALREQRRLGNAGKVFQVRFLDTADAFNDNNKKISTTKSPSLHKDAEPKEFLRHNLRMRARQGIETAMKYEQESGIGFLRRQQASDDPRTDATGGTSRGESRTREPRRPPGVTREEVALSLSMLKESFPQYYNDDGHVLSSGQNANGGGTGKSSSTRPKLKASAAAHHVDGLSSREGTSRSSRSVERLPAPPPTSETMTRPVSFEGQQYASLRIVEPTTRSRSTGVQGSKTPPGRSSVTTHYQPVSTTPPTTTTATTALSEESAQYQYPGVEPRSTCTTQPPNLQGGEHTYGNRTHMHARTRASTPGVPKMSKVRTALKKISSMLKAFVQGVGLLPSPTKSTVPKKDRQRQRHRQTPDAASDSSYDNNALRSRGIRPVDVQGQGEGVTGRRRRRRPLLQSTSRLDVSSTVASTSREASRYYSDASSSQWIMSANRTSSADEDDDEQSVRQGRVGTTRRSTPRKLQKSRKARVSKD
ncbi:hypothetical protein PV08_03251 [Exophiala spinifera]|uniref:Uncharacterized protein n=1 Tax=Exophiala spinifera TaxID=91928 RepID=A0A0D2A201_9EURO|nr:uncharacterized protein PV08_03251 [Exophiala spinifera]KIW18962.1 hypothetical protein PV08_03251 [Exophiala spinifera]